VYNKHQTLVCYVNYGIFAVLDDCLVLLAQCLSVYIYTHVAGRTINWRSIYVSIGSAVQCQTHI